MAAKKATETPVIEAPKPVIAVEYNGNLYPSMQTAEGARAKADLLGILCPPESQTLSMVFSHHGYDEQRGRRNAVDEAIKNAERVHGILSRYLDAAKISG